jgi:hypothetical protein
MSDRFDFEETLTKCWCIVDDLKELSAHIIEHDVVGSDTIHNYIFGLANVYDVKFHKLWDLYESQYMETIRENKMLELECKALREQLITAENAEYSGIGTNFGQLDTQGFGIAAMKPNKKGKK